MFFHPQKVPNQYKDHQYLKSNYHPIVDIEKSLISKRILYQAEILSVQEFNSTWNMEFIFDLHEISIEFSVLKP